MPERLPFLAVKGFRSFQHYSKRNPPWIKLYGSVLSDAAFLQMPEIAQAQLIKLWILASQLGHPLPNNPKLLAGRIGTVGRFYLAEIIEAGFLLPTADENPLADDDEIASKKNENALAKPSPNASAPVRGDAPSRQSSELESRESSSLPACVRLCVAANRGLSEHPTRPQPMPRVVPTSGSALEAVEAIEKAGVPVDFAESAIYEIAKSHKATDEVNSLKYFVRAVVRKYEEFGAARAMKAAGSIAPVPAKEDPLDQLLRERGEQPRRAS